jgi:tRNA G18 (ribose-2'-O)-methylase SpoU
MLSYAAGKVSIPMAVRSESLNAAIAAALMLWEMIR